jgi:NTE family protein
MQAGRLRMAGSVTVVLLLLVAVLLGGCTTPATLGEPLEQTAGRGGYRFDDAAPARHRDDLLLILTFSGGGTRAAAYFALHGDRLFRDFLSDFLEHDVEQDLWWSVFASPRNWLRLGSGRYSRGDLFAEYLDRRLFAGATFAALATGEDRPFLVLNATDLSIAGRFEFTQDWFDVICVDLARYPLARGVAASAAYPILTTPLAIENRAGRCGYVPPPWLDPAGLTVELEAACVEPPREVRRLRWLSQAAMA